MARTLGLSGLALPSNLMPANFANMSGYWEPQDVSDYNDSLLGELKSRWDDPFGPDLTGLTEPSRLQHVENAKMLIASNYGEADQIVLKEPRLNQVGPIWIAALEELGYKIRVIVMVRTPIEVARSLQRRDQFSIEYGALVWASNMLRAEKFSATFPRCFVSYDRLREDPEQTLARISDHCELVLPRRSWASYLEIEEYLREEMRHERADDDHARVQPEIDVLHGYFHRLSHDVCPVDGNVLARTAMWVMQLERLVVPIARSLASRFSG